MMPTRPRNHGFVVVAVFISNGREEYAGRLDFADDVAARRLDNCQPPSISPRLPSGVAPPRSANPVQLIDARRTDFSATPDQPKLTAPLREPGGGAMLQKINVALLSVVVHLCALVALGLWLIPIDQSQHDAITLSTVDSIHDPPLVSLEIKTETPPINQEFEDHVPIAVDAMLMSVEINPVKVQPVQHLAVERFRDYGLARTHPTKSMELSVLERPPSNGRRKRTLFCGIHGYGNRVVYVIDRSSSMAGRRIAEAKNHLVRSMYQLQSQQEYFVYLYNTSAIAMPVEFRNQICSGMVPASNVFVKHTAAWLQNVSASGSTDPSQAIVSALDLRPDVIYLLSDGEFQVTRKITDAIRESKRRIPIHTIAFQTNRHVASLEQIAQLTGGVYRAVK